MSCDARRANAPQQRSWVSLRPGTPFGSQSWLTHRVAGFQYWQVRMPLTTEASLAGALRQPTSAGTTRTRGTARDYFRPQQKASDRRGHSQVTTTARRSGESNSMDRCVKRRTQLVQKSPPIQATSHVTVGHSTHGKSSFRIAVHSKVVAKIGFAQPPFPVELPARSLHFCGPKVSFKGYEQAEFSTSRQ